MKATKWIIQNQRLGERLPRGDRLSLSAPRDSSRDPAFADFNSFPLLSPDEFEDGGTCKACAEAEEDEEDVRDARIALAEEGDRISYDEYRRKRGLT
jgi:hypothetical protein